MKVKVIDGLATAVEAVGYEPETIFGKTQGFGQLDCGSLYPAKQGTVLRCDTS